MLFYGQVISKESETLNVVEAVEFDVTPIGMNAKVIATHHIHNTTDKSMDAVITMTLDDETCVSGFEIEHNGKTIVSQLKEKEQAKREQSDATSNGYSSAVMEKVDDTTFSLSLGLIEPTSTMLVRVTYLTKLQLDEDEVIMKFPAPMQKEMNYNIIVHGSNGDIKMSGKLSGEEEVTMKRDEKGMIVMKDEDTEEVIAASTFINKEKEGQVEVIFICDRSGSMSGVGITSLKETLQLFLRQLPEGSKFNIISFGSRCESMFEDSIEYNDITLENASKEVEQFDADFGGTTLLEPLKAAMTHKCQIIVLTDGEAWDKREVLELCKNDHDNVVHMVGLGNDVDVELVRNIPRICGGLSAISKNPLKLKEAVSKITERILTPVINEPKAKWTVQGEQYPKEINKFNSDTTVFLKIEKEEDKIGCELEGKIGEKTITMKNESNEIKTGDVVEQIYASMKLRELEANDNKEEAIKISLRYNVLSKYTAFISVDKTSKQEVKEVKTIKLSELRSEEHHSMHCGGGGFGGRRMLCCRAPMAAPPKMFCCRMESAPRTQEKRVDFTCKEEKKELSSSQMFNELVKLQKANGSFNNLESLYPSITSLIEKHQDVDKVIIMTIVAVTIFEKRFADKKVEWNLLVKKSKKYLDKQEFDQQLYTEAESFVSSL